MKLINYSFGRLYKPDIRDRRFMMQPSVQKADQILYRYWYAGGVLDQGSTPACVGFSSYKFLEAAPVLNTQMPFGPYDLYKAAQEFDEWPGEDYEGTSVRGAFKFLQSKGYVKEYRWAFNLYLILSQVLTVGPVVFGSNWFENMLEPDKDGLITPSGEIVGGHAYLLVGAHRGRYFKRASKKLGVFRVLNSWGEGWGQRGRAWIQFKHVRELLKSGNAEACVAHEIDLDKLNSGGGA